jgi:hypothetical protein
MYMYVLTVHKKCRDPAGPHAPRSLFVRLFDFDFNMI